MKRKPRTSNPKRPIIEEPVDEAESELHGISPGDLGPEIDEPDSELEFYDAGHDALEGLAEERGEAL